MENLFSFYLVNPPWFFFKKLLFTKFGLYTNLVTKSLIYRNLSLYSIGSFTSKYPTSNSQVVGVSNFNRQYLLPIPTLAISSLKKPYNLLVLYLFYISLMVYSPCLHLFNLPFTFILLQPLTYLTILQSKFFFKIRNY